MRASVGISMSLFPFEDGSVEDTFLTEGSTAFDLGVLLKIFAILGLDFSNKNGSAIKDDRKVNVPDVSIPRNENGSRWMYLLLSYLVQLFIALAST